MAAVTKIQRYLLESDVLSVADTTDVSVFADAARANEVVPLPTSCLFKFVALHAVFNQQELWEAFIGEGIVSYSDRSIKGSGHPQLAPALQTERQENTVLELSGDSAATNFSRWGAFLA